MNHRKGTVTLALDNGNVLTWSANTDPRIIAANPLNMTVYCKSGSDAAVLTREARAWGTTRVFFEGPVPARYGAY